MQSEAPRRRRPVLVLVLALLALAVSGVFVACGSDDEGSSTSGGSDTSSADTGASGGADTSAPEISDADQSELLKKAFYTDDVDASPELLKALTLANTPLTPEQEDKLRECMNADTCDTGQGDLVLGIADSFGDIPWRVQARLEQTAQAIQTGKVKTIIYTNGHADLQKSQANFRSLLAKKVDIITAYFDFAPAMTSLFRQAQQQGTIVGSYISVIPHGDGPKDAIQFSEDYTEVANSMADAVKKSNPDGGNVAFFTGVPGNPTASAWQPVAQQNLEAAGWKVIYKGNTNWTPAGELQQVSAVIAKGEPIDAFIYDGAGPTNLIKGFQRAGKEVPALASFSPDNAYYELWQKLGEPDNQAVTDSQTWTGRVAVSAAVDRALGEEVPGEIKLPQPLVQTAAAKPYWQPTLKYGPAYLPPTFSGDIITEFNK